MKHLHIAIAILMASAAMCSCTRTESRIAPFGWESTGEPEDSLMRILEYMFADNFPGDSLIEPVDRYLKATENKKDNKVINARRCYWQGRLAMRLGNREAGRPLLRKTIEIVDSSSAPYDYNRYRWTLEKRADYKDNGAWYSHLTDNIKFFTECNDLMLTASNYMDLGWLMMEAGWPERSISYAMRADSLLTLANMEGPSAGNRINIANAMFNSGDTLNAVAMLKTTDSLPAVRTDRELSALVDYNLYVMTNDTAALNRAYTNVCSDESRPGLRGVLACHIADMALKHNDMIKARLHSDEARKYLPYIIQGDHRAFILRTSATTEAMSGNSAGACRIWDEYAHTVDSINKAMLNGQLITAETGRQISHVELMAAESRQRDRMKLWSVVGIAIISAITVAFIISRRIQHIKAQQLSERLQREASQRSELAMTLMVKEKEKLIERLSLKIKEFTESGHMDPETASEIESAIKADAVTTRDSNEFARVFSSVSPDFVKRLNERYPGLGKNSVRIASYIATGMDNRHIARVMNIRVESVKQARWRLRSQMKLSTTDNLDQILRDLL